MTRPTGDATSRVMTVWLELAIVVGLVLLNGFFAMAEMAVVSSRRIRLQQMAEDGNAGAARALALPKIPAASCPACRSASR